MGSWRAAFALSKGELNELTPPGTVRILNEQETDSHHDHMVKYPRPSNSPRDPLNFPMWRKIAVLLVVSIYAFVTNYTSSITAPVLQLWFTTFPQEPKSFSELSYLVSCNNLLLGSSNIWWVPLSNWMGRRPVLLVATLLLTLCSVWGGVATSFSSLLAARILQGAGGGAADSVAPALIGDLFFIHERGRAMAVYTIFLCGGSIIGGLTGGYVGFNHGWASVYWVSTGLSAFVFLSVLLLVPETLFERVLLEDASNSDDAKDVDSKEVEMVQTRASSSPVAGEHFSYIQSLGFRKPRGNLFRFFLQPWKTLALPGTWVVMLHYAGLVGGIVSVALLGPQLLAEPPYLWGVNAGLINAGGLIGAIIGYLYTYVLADLLLKRKAKKQHHGIAEAEDRLPSMFFPLAVATGGFLVFGFSAQYPAPDRWAGLQVGYGMIAFGLTQVPSVGFNYLIDAYRHLAADCFTMVTVLRAIVSFAWTFFIASWVDESGAAEPFGIFGMLMGIFGLLTVPLWLFGKRMRVATSGIVTRRA